MRCGATLSQQSRTRARPTQRPRTMLPRRGGRWCANAKNRQCKYAMAHGSQRRSREHRKSHHGRVSPPHRSTQRIMPRPPSDPDPPATPTRRRRPCMLRPAALCRQKVDFAGPNTEPHHGPAGKLRPQTRLHPAARPFHPSIHDPPDTQKPRVSYYSCCAIDLYSLAMHAAACPRLRPRAATGRASSSQPLPALLLATGADH